MKVVFVIDSITELKNKINMLTTRFGDEILYVVKSNLLEIVKTYGITANAVYKNNYIKSMHILLSYHLDNDIVICYSSLKLTNNLLNSFIEKIGDKSKIVNVMPSYNAFERFCNSTYNIYEIAFKWHISCKKSVIFAFCKSTKKSPLERQI